MCKHSKQWQVLRLLGTIHDIRLCTSLAISGTAGISPLFLGRAAQVIFRETIAQEFEGVFGGVDELELVEIFRRDRAGVRKGLEVEDTVPVFAAVDDDQNFLRQLVGLRESEDFEEFVHGAEAAGEDDESLGEIGEPEFAHEEVMELKVQRGRDVVVGYCSKGSWILRPMVLPPAS